ncbi:uncharacterized protein LOC100212364 isoform X1 [Hydra vulgaris]|uniref:uncharacterized protein LOC100212364 isoform X1 n=1 Tax=Hydra vulgaris TaxID=6087 RepID=UPI00019240DE|nr:uncharacterized protein LOC100212364 [Hydra vulgaris]
MEYLVQIKMDNESFVSVDLNDNNKCEICHQITNEQIVSVILNDEFTTFEGSQSKHIGRITMAHHYCLKKWADIIERNLKSSYKKKTNQSIYNDNSNIASVKNYITESKTICQTECIKQSNQFSLKASKNNYKNYTNEANGNISRNNYKNYTNEADENISRNNYKNELLKMNCTELNHLLKQLVSLVEESSMVLVSELQLKDKLTQEIGCQYLLISQLIDLRKRV